MTDPLDRLSDLRSVAVPPLPGAAAARARGRQRTRRTRAALTVTAAAVAVVGISAASALVGGVDRTVPQPVASSAPTAETPLQAALLDADDVSSVLQEEWEVRGTEDLPFTADLPACTPSFVVGEQALRFLTGPDGEVLGTRVELFADAAAAQQRYAEVSELGDLCGPDTLQVDEPTGPAGSLRGVVRDPFGVRPFALSLVDRAVVLLMTDGEALGPRLVDRADAEVRAALPETEPAPAPTAAAATPPATVIDTVQPPSYFAQAGEIASFRSPTGNVFCQLADSQVACEVPGHTYEPPPRPADCDLDWGDMVAVTENGAEFLCHGDTGYVPDALVLEYGAVISNASFTCTSRETGMTCETSDGPPGFRVAKASYELS